MILDFINLYNGGCKGRLILRERRRASFFAAFKSTSQTRAQFETLTRSLLMISAAVFGLFGAFYFDLQSLKYFDKHEFTV